MGHQQNRTSGGFIYPWWNVEKHISLQARLSNCSSITSKIFFLIDECLCETRMTHFCQTYKNGRQFSTTHLLILPQPNAPSSLSPSEAIHNSISRSSYATESSLIVHQLSWQTSPHRATDEAVLGKWQGRRPLPAWSPDQDSAYPAIYPLWTGGRAERRKDEVDDRRNEAVNQLSAKTKGAQRKMLPVASDRPNGSFINDIHFS